MDADIHLCVLYRYDDITEVFSVLHKMIPREV